MRAYILVRKRKLAKQRGLITCSSKEGSWMEWAILWALWNASKALQNPASSKWTLPTVKWTNPAVAHWSHSLYKLREKCKIIDISTRTHLNGRWSHRLDSSLVRLPIARHSIIPPSNFELERRISTLYRQLIAIADTSLTCLFQISRKLTLHRLHKLYKEWKGLKPVPSVI